MRLLNILKILFIGLLVILLVLFVSQHMEEVKINLFVYTFQVPLFVLLFIFGFVGFIIPTLVFTWRERALSSKLSSIFDASLDVFFLKYQKPKTNLENIKSVKPLYFVFANILKYTPTYEDDIYSKFEKARSLRYENPQEAINLLDIESIQSLQLKRNILFDKKDYQVALNTQEQILKNIPRKEKPYQKDILNTIKSLKNVDLEDKTKRLEELEDAFNDTKNELTGFLYVSELLAQDKTKDASKVLDNMLQLNLKDKLLLVGCSMPQTAVYLMAADIEKGVSPEVLGIFYIYIGAPNKIKLLADVTTNNEVVDFLLKAHQDQAKLDAYNIVLKNLKLWKCKDCAATFNQYSPKCVCDSWFSLEPHIGL